MAFRQFWNNIDFLEFGERWICGIFFQLLKPARSLLTMVWCLVASAFQDTCGNWNRSKISHCSVSVCSEPSSAKWVGFLNFKIYTISRTVNVGILAYLQTIVELNLLVSSLVFAEKNQISETLEVLNLLHSSV